MASNSDGSGSNGTLPRNFTLNTSRDYDSLKQQYEKTNNELTNSRRRCDHALNDLDYYREQHRAAMNQLEVTSQDSATIRTKYAELLTDKQRLEQENQRLRTELENYRDKDATTTTTTTTTTAGYLTTTNTTDTLYISPNQTVSKLELAKDENNRLTKQLELMEQERKDAQREIASLKQQVVKLYKANQKILQQYEEAEKQMLAIKIKANKDVKRLTEDRNATLAEYTLVMSERDQVHKEMEKLSEDLSQALKKNKLLDGDNQELTNDKQAISYQLESLRREIASALYERDKAIKECNELREKFGELGNVCNDENRRHREQTTRSRLLDSLGNIIVHNDLNNIGRKDSLLLQNDVHAINQRQRLDNLDQANQELESLRKNLDKLQIELSDAIQEAEVSKGRRDWAFSERDKIVQERESIRTLCDNMRKERDRAVSELAESLRESDAIKKQRNELLKEVKALKEMLEIHMVDRDDDDDDDDDVDDDNHHQHHHQSYINHHPPNNNNKFNDSSSEIIEIELTYDGLTATSSSSISDLGLELVGGRDDPHFPGDGGVYVAGVAQGSIADGKLRPNDRIQRVNDVDCSAVSRRMVLEAIRASLPITRIVINRKRKRFPSPPPTLPTQITKWVHTARLVPGCHGLTLNMGVYISRISDGSLAARDKSLSVGDRILRINEKSMDEIDSIHEAMRVLNDDTVDVITVTALKISHPECPNVFTPVLRHKRENRSSQTDEHDYLVVNQQEKNSGAWLKEKIDFMRGRRHTNKDNDNKKKYNRNSSPSPLELSGGPEQAIAELDLVLDSYRGGGGGGGSNNNNNNIGTVKRAKRNSGVKEQEKNGGTWPKARAAAFLQPVIGSTVVVRKKERPALSLLKESTNDCYRNSTPIPLSLVSVATTTTAAAAATTPTTTNRHSVYKSIDSTSSMTNNNNNNKNNSNNGIVANSGHFSHHIGDSFEKLRLPPPPSNRLSTNLTSDNSLDYPVHRYIEKDVYYRKYKPNLTKYLYDCERDNSGGGDSTNSIIPPPPPPHSRIHSQLWSGGGGGGSSSSGGGAGIQRLQFPPHHHPYTTTTTTTTQPTNNEHLRDSFSFEPPLYHHNHNHNHHQYQHQQHSTSVDGGNNLINRNKIGQQSPNYHNHHHHHHNRDTDLLEIGTFPRKRENQRIRIPSNPSVTSKVSTGSIERSSERGSPMPIFHVEVLSPGEAGTNNNTNNNTVTNNNGGGGNNNGKEYCSWISSGQYKPLPGELRRVHIDKSNEPLGIQINCPESGGIFVSTVNDNSLASRVGLQIGDQLLEVCGINMRNATYNLAANVLRQCGNSITMLVQYSPDKYNELGGSGSCTDTSSNGDDGDGEATPCNSPKEVRKSHPVKITSLPPPNSLIRSGGQQTSATLQRQNNTNSRDDDEPRYLYIETLKTSNLGISLVGGNAAGIFIHSVQPDSLAYHAGLRTGDQILEYNGSDLRNATAEEAAYELAKPADKVTVLAHYRIDRYNEIKDKPGDSLYVRCGFDRPGNELTEPPQLSFTKDDVLYVDNTMFNGVPGQWRAWRLDGEGRRQQCGIIPSKYKVEEELLLRRGGGGGSNGNGNGDFDQTMTTSTTSTNSNRSISSSVLPPRRSFFRRKKHQRHSKELASFCSLAGPGWYSDGGSLHEEPAPPPAYQRVERLTRPEFRPVLVLGPLAECVVDKLVSDFPDEFGRAPAETRRCSQAQLDRELADGHLVEYRRRGSCWECITVAAVRQVSRARLHCMLDVAAGSVERLHRHRIIPVVLLIKFKTTKQIREVKKDAVRYSLDKLSEKAAKEMFEHGHKLEAEYRHLVTAVVSAGANVAHVCAQVKAAVDVEHRKSQWVPVG